MTVENEQLAMYLSDEIIILRELETERKGTHNDTSSRL